ncbi:hypothetical protein SAMN04488519_10669 [Algoriphagus ornithinivorans]|uniref:Uncharacterized protein n=1 Tax=Algoriphagus ornithinivorans TaxID=226506 RepID=A0A1I5GU54_9BACT|nr:hypothetical protein [Algoriphagus ornithinivorans]SFO39545.1 hypothetical protein SAMN04488519_10669 [Algoriphagus ornithinivorans]
MENDNKTKYKEGDKVFTKVNPTVPLIVRRFYKEIYYCTYAEDPEKKELALFEREII